MPRAHRKIELDVIWTNRHQCVECKEPLARGQIIGLRERKIGALGRQIVCLTCVTLELNRRAEAFERCGYDRAAYLTSIGREGAH